MELSDGMHNIYSHEALENSYLADLRFFLNSIYITYWVMKDNNMRS